MLRFANLCFQRAVRLNRFNITKKFFYSSPNKQVIYRFYTKETEEDSSASTSEPRPKMDEMEQKEISEDDEESDKEKSEKGNKRNIPLLGGGLEKLQGGLMEENYFSTQNKEIIRKLHEHGTKTQEVVEEKTTPPAEQLTEEEWVEFEKSRNSTKWSDGSSKSRQKNPMEENFFLNEQLDTLKILSDKMREIQERRRQQAEGVKRSDETIEDHDEDPIEELLKETTSDEEAANQAAKQQGQEQSTKLVESPLPLDKVDPTKGDK